MIDLEKYDQNIHPAFIKPEDSLHAVIVHGDVANPELDIFRPLFLVIRHDKDGLVTTNAVIVNNTVSFLPTEYEVCSAEEWDGNDMLLGFVQLDPDETALETRLKDLFLFDIKDAT